jgi:hypothetical protein
MEKDNSKKSIGSILRPQTAKHQNKRTGKPLIQKLEAAKRSNLKPKPIQLSRPISPAVNLKPNEK